MQQLKSALCQLVHGYPKQATATIEMLMNSDPNFFRNLTGLIVDRLDQAAIATFNTLAIRCRSKKDIKDFLTLQQIYNCLRTVLADEATSFQNKKLLSPSLTQYLSGACSTHKQVLDLKKYIQKSDKQSVLVVLDAIVKSKQIERPIKIETITQLFDLVISEVLKYFNRIFEISQHPDNTFKQLFGILLNRIRYFIDLTNYIFTSVFEDISHPYEYQALVTLSENKRLADILSYLTEWKHPQEGTFKYIWVRDICDSNGDILYQFYEINNLKEKVFQIIASIIGKTDPMFNLHLCNSILMSNTLSLSMNVLAELLYTSDNFDEFNKDYLIGPLCDSMLEFVAQCLRLNDIVEDFTHKIETAKLIKCLLCFLRVRDTDISSMDEDYFFNFLQGFAGDFNLNEVSRYGVSRLIQMCCKKFDTFPFAMFQTCYNNIIKQLSTRQVSLGGQGGDFYQHLYLHPAQSNECVMGQNQISCYLLGLISMQHQIATRTDFREALSSFLVVLDIHHFQPQQVSMIYYILATNSCLFYDEGLVDATARFVTWAFEVSYTRKQCSVMCLQFIKQLFFKVIAPLPIQNKLSQKFINNVVNTIWEMISISCSIKQDFNNQHFYDVLYELVDTQNIYALDKHYNSILKGMKQREKSTQKEEQNLFPHKNKEKQNKRSMKLEKVGDYLLTKYGGFITVVLQKCCEKLARQVMKQEHDKLLTLKLHQVIIQCLKSLDWLLQLQVEGSEIAHIQFGDYIKAPSQMIKAIMGNTENAEYHGSMSVEQTLNLLQIVSILINQQRKRLMFKPSQSAIDCSLFEALFPVMLKHPFGQAWLVSICQFTHRINGKFKLDEIELIMEMIKSCYEKHYHNQLKFNQLNLFAIVLLNYYQPQNWHKIHQIVRLNIVRLIKIDSENDRSKTLQKMASFGFESEIIFGITIIRLFHVYLFGFRMQPSNQLLEELLRCYDKYVEKYCLVETSHLIIGFQSSYKQMNEHNFEKLLDILLQILNKLMLSSKYYGSQRLEQAQIRKLSHKIGCISVDPYRQFKSFIQILQNNQINLLKHPHHAQIIKNMMNITTFMGQPRKFYSISKKNTQLHL